MFRLISIFMVLNLGKKKFLITVWDESAQSAKKSDKFSAMGRPLNNLSPTQGSGNITEEGMGRM